MNILSSLIEAAVQECRECGSGRVEKGNIEICAEWEDDNIAIYILENGIIKFDYKLKEELRC